MNGHAMTYITCLITLLAWGGGAHAAQLHTVKEGESLRTIADAVGCSLAELVTANSERLTDAHSLSLGLTLVIPDNCSGGATRLGLEDQDDLLSMPAEVKHCGWGAQGVNTEGLLRLLEDHEFIPPPGFRMVLIKTQPAMSGDRIKKQTVFTYGPVARSEDWHPGEAAGLFAAVAALDFVASNGMRGDTEVTFFDHGTASTTTLYDLVEDTLRKGRPFAYNRLAQLAGYTRLNAAKGPLGMLGLESTTLRHVFDASRWADAGRRRSLRYSPRVALKRPGRNITVEAREGVAVHGCQRDVCTTVTDLARLMCVISQHDRLPLSRRLRLGEQDSPSHRLALLGSLRKRKRQAVGVLERTIRQALPHYRGYDMLQRGGERGGWHTVNMALISAKPHRPDWVVSFAAHGSLKELKVAAEVVSTILKGGML